MKTLDFLVPQWHEDFSVVRGLLDSIAVQRQVNFDNIKVIMYNDGAPEYYIDEKLFEQYPFKVQYIKGEHKGVSGARNACLDASTADYVIFCDSDDALCDSCGLWILMQEMEKGFDTLVSVFREETKTPDGKITYINHDMDSTFVHGKVHRRKFLVDEKIRWDESLTIHEDSYFNVLCQRIAKDAKYCQVPWFCWCWREASICRHDPQYMLKTYPNMLQSQTALIKELMRRGKNDVAQFHIVNAIYDSYFTLNKKEWLDTTNAEYRAIVDKCVKEFIATFRILYDTAPEQIKLQVAAGVKQHKYAEGLLFESITFDQWFKQMTEVAG